MTLFGSEKRVTLSRECSLRSDEMKCHVKDHENIIEFFVSKVLKSHLPLKDSVALPLANYVRRALDMPEGAGSIGILPNELQVRNI